MATGRPYEKVSQDAALPSVVGSANISRTSDSNYFASKPSMRAVIARAMVLGSKLNLRRSATGTS